MTTVRTQASRAQVVALARRWIGTPYHHQASRLKIGTDCIGLVRGIWRDLYGAEPEPLPGYGRDWAEATGRETLLEAARRHLVEIEPSIARSGDVLAFRYRARSVAKHVGILAGSGVVGGSSLLSAHPTLIHAVEGTPVVEVPLVAWWRRRIAAAFSFPGLVD